MFTSIRTWVKAVEHKVDRAWGYDFTTPRGRRRAWWHFMLVDHGILRIYWKNLHEISPGVWRSNQPSPRRLEEYKLLGIKTILNLRGANKRSNSRFERRACRKLGLSLVNFSLSARILPPASKLLSLLDAFETTEKPFLMHCKSGADRAGLASAFYLMHVLDAPVSTAKKQLGLRYIHVRKFQTGILDLLLDAYEADIAKDPMPIRRWIETRYDPEALTAEFDSLSVLAR